MTYTFRFAPRRPLPAATLVLALLAGAAADLAAAPVVNDISKPASGVAEDAYRRGIEALGKNDLKTAETSFREALRQNPQMVSALLAMGEIAFMSRRTDDAGRWIEQAVKANPTDANAQASLGRFLALKGRRAEAEVALKQAAALDGKAFRPRVDLADMLLSRGDAEAAIPLYREALAISPDHPGARYALGQALLSAGYPAAAATELTQAASLAKGNPLPLVALARAEFARKQPDAAMKAVDQALQIQPTLVEGLILKGDLLESRGLPEPALRHYERASTCSQAGVAAFAHRDGPATTRSA